MATILDKIVAQREIDVREARALVPEAALREAIAASPFGPPLDFFARLARDAPVALAAEFKRASPSKGDIAMDADISEQVRQYVQAGAGAISVLTEPTWFRGSLEDMRTARRTVAEAADRPAILRKDFIIDEYQLLEARAYGADSACVARARSPRRPGPVT